MVVTHEGVFYVFSIDMEKGGEGVLVKQYSWVVLGTLGPYSLTPLLECLIRTIVWVSL